MKTSIKLLFTILLLFITVFSIQAQSYMRRPFYGEFFGGATFASMDIAGDNKFKKNKLGFMIGGNVNYRFFSNIVVQSGFHLIKKGSFKHEDRIVDLDGPQKRIDVKNTVDANYIQIPLNLGIEIPIKRGLNFSINAGVFGAYGFKGQTKQEGYEATILNGVYDNTTSLDRNGYDTFSNTNLKRFDYGIGGNVGIIYDIFILRFQYDHGLANVATDALGTEWKTRNYAFCFGFRF